MLSARAAASAAIRVAGRGRTSSSSLAAARRSAALLTNSASSPTTTTTRLFSNGTARALSSIAEPGPSLFNVPSSALMDKDGQKVGGVPEEKHNGIDTQLRADVRAMGSLLGKSDSSRRPREDSSSSLTAARRSAAAVLANNIASSPTTTSTTTRLFSRGTSRALSSIAEPGPSLFNVSASALDKDGRAVVGGVPEEKHNGIDTQLRADVRAMGSLLGKIITEHEGPEIFDKVEKMRSLAKEWREAGAGRNPSLRSDADSAFSSMATFASSLSSSELFLISRAFTHFLALANAAESHHRCRKLRRAVTAEDSGIGALSTKRDSCGGVIPKLVAESGASAKEIWEALSSQTVELVLTAHPTQVNRTTLLDKQKRIQELLNEADFDRDAGLVTPYRKKDIDDCLQMIISGIWQSDEVARQKPTPIVEAERGVMVIESVLWETLPNFLRKLDATMKDSLGDEYGLPLTATPIKIASWMGGDRDGNPNVTPSVTREVCLSNRAKCASLIAADVRVIINKLSITNCSDELRTIVGEDVQEPYRHFLYQVEKKLKRTAAWARDELENVHAGRPGGEPAEDIYLKKSDLIDELMLVHRSLCETGNEIIADRMMTNVIRNVSAFGLTLVPLDVRQESDRHEEALDCVTRHLGLGSYAQWDEPTRLSWLQKELSSHRPLLRPGEWDHHTELFTPTAVDTLETFRMIADQHEDSLGAYVISQATSASDVLAVLLLQRDAGVKEPLRVVPLFETLDDLHGAADTMDTLFGLPAYKGSIGGKQEVMIGYSDSAKDAGRLAASWAQYETQEKLAEVASKHSVDITFFHGKGGTVGRGGNPATFNAILAHAPDTINGYFRVTEQGEMINQNFGFHDRAERTLDIYTAAVLSEKLTDRPRPTAEWRDVMKKLSDVSCDAYRAVVRGDERFVPYFRSATPELELSSLNIGSRPAKRKATGGVESLRAIPWNFSWTQTRLNLPTWLGVGEAIGEVLNGDDGETLRTMYEEWGSFQTTVDLVEMVLAKSEPGIAAHYDRVLVKDDRAKELGTHVRKIHAETEDTVLDLTGHECLSEYDTLLRQMMQVRNPYVDCLNVLQVETLDRLRSTEDEAEQKKLSDALLTTITGVANGMGNTG
eukprot:CAMPEP_0197465530 /NCGR_PEP_ID=MMETSP1175-20131217/64586_1 /TAXON_ID=1003142 /ORGANISM="Triceratium dubium, Strain CCMP147" /LENGTH=1118 /DNA_ID=CAMNT_0043001547 /DNA_START=80 /DNA_END=3437 /DNA_ORIENTATION=+